MADTVKGLFGGETAAQKQAEQAAAAGQRRQLAELARQQATEDQSRATGGRAQGRRLITFIGSADGDSTIG